MRCSCFRYRFYNGSCAFWKVGQCSIRSSKSGQRYLLICCVLVFSLCKMNKDEKPSFWGNSDSVCFQSFLNISIRKNNNYKNRIFPKTQNFLEVYFLRPTGFTPNIKNASVACYRRPESFFWISFRNVRVRVKTEYTQNHDPGISTIPQLLTI